MCGGTQKASIIDKLLTILCDDLGSYYEQFKNPFCDKCVEKIHHRLNIACSLTVVEDLSIEDNNTNEVGKNAQEQYR